MKKFVVMMIATFILAISLNLCSASIKDYYDNDPDYILMWAHQGSYSYLYLPSIDVQEYNPPHYQIAYDYISVNIKNEKEVWSRGIKRFNWSTKESFHLENGRWVVDNVSGDLAPAIRNRHAADTIFRAAYNMDFYGY